MFSNQNLLFPAFTFYLCTGLCLKYTLNIAKTVTYSLCAHIAVFYLKLDFLLHIYVISKNLNIKRVVKLYQVYVWCGYRESGNGWENSQDVVALVVLFPTCFISCGGCTKYTDSFQREKKVSLKH